MKITEKFENNIKNGRDVSVNFIDSKTLLREQIEQSTYTISQISNNLGLNNYLYEILDQNNAKKYSRDRIIAILLFIKSDIDVAQRILQGFGHSKLYVRIPRDLIIFKGLYNKEDLWEIDNKLVESGFSSIFNK